MSALRASAVLHRITQFVGMTDTQIFTVLVMPFLLVLTCSMVFFSSRTMKLKKPADPSVLVTRPNSYARKPRKTITASRADWRGRGVGALRPAPNLWRC
jgi:hypothetical protein